MCGMHEEINPRNVGLGTQASAQHTGKVLRETGRGLTEPGEKGAFRGGAGISDVASSRIPGPCIFYEQFEENGGKPH